MDARDGSPEHILGYTIRSRTRIYVSYLLPSSLELMVYIVQIIADSAVSYQHFHCGQPLFGWLTLMLVVAPAVLCFVFVMTSPEQWTNPQHANKKRFIGYQFVNLLLFPLFAVYRFSRRIFWSVEALFHDNDDTERMRCLAKSGECSTCELYHLTQAYAQAAPQIILQLYHMLRQDLFRDYNTTTVQAISLVFSTINLAAITVAYQRFESQKLAGRPYPWAVPNQIENQKQRLIAAERLRHETERKRRESERTISHFPESNKIMENFKLRHSDPNLPTGHKETVPRDSPSADIIVHINGGGGVDEVDNGASPDPPINSTDDEKIKSTSPLLRKSTDTSAINEIEQWDTVPEIPPPPLPGRAAAPELRSQTSFEPSSNTSATGRHRLSATANRISTFKDMLWLNAQLYIKENVPRPPKMLTERLEDKVAEAEKRNAQPTPSPEPMPTANDETDFFIPRPREIVNGIEQDDFAAKTVAFLGWVAFVCMRMIALSTFCVFYTKAFFIILGAHYGLMLFWLALESKFQDKLNRTLFYLLLAYVYIFVILEFRIKFKHIRVWYVGFFVVTMVENLVMTFTWWFQAEFESWWYGFLYDGVIYSGILFSVTLVVYYCILKPKDVVYLLANNE